MSVSFIACASARYVTRQSIEVPGAIAIGFFECDELLEVVAHRVLLRYADAAVQLNALAAYDPSRFHGHHRGCGNDRAAYLCVGVQMRNATVEDGAHFLHFDKHLRHPVLQGL